MTLPNEVFEELPCSIVAVGCALGYTDSAAVAALKPAGLHEDGYLSLKGMEALIRAKLKVDCKVYYKRWCRPTLAEFMEKNKGRKAIVCLLGHFVYWDGVDYHSFFYNNDDPVVQVWYLED